MEKWPIGVFASIDHGLGVKLEVARDLAVPTIQLHAPSKKVRTPEHARDFLARCAEMRIAITAVFGGFDGESYADIPTTNRTVGLVPAETRTARTQEMKEISDFAARLGVGVIALHVGFIPHEGADSTYRQVVAVTQEICDHARKNGQNLHLETGQETADALLQFITDVRRENLFINFDPANMILYGTGNPIQALWKVGPYVRSVHCKDGRWANRPGQEWGQEVPLGEGDVGMETYVRTLAAIGYTGPLTIEREIPQDPQRQKTEISHAITLLRDLKARLG
jgi:sugar phosphate isomerase/epimerase